MKSDPILITGGAGFIGSHLVDLFEIENINYTVLDNLSSGSLDNIPSALTNNKFVFDDLKDNQLLAKLINASSGVIHLASTVGVKNVMAHPLDSIETNINSLKFIAQKCAEYGKPLIYFSSSLVYSSPNNKIVYFSEEEETHTLGFHPVSIYVTTKMTGELICQYYKDTMGLDYIIIRPFNMIGTRQRSESGMVVPSFIRSAILEGKIDVYGTGNQTRTFSDVKTAVKLLWNIIENPGAYGHIFNLATNSKSVPIIDLAFLIKRILNEPIDINLVPYTSVYGHYYRDVEHRSPSLEKLRGYIPSWEERELETILIEIIDHIKKTINLVSIPDSFVNNVKN